MQALADEQQVGRLEGQVGDLGGQIDRVETRLGARIDGVETKLDARIDGVETKIEAVRAEARADFRTLLAVVLGMFGAMIIGFGTLLLQHI